MNTPILYICTHVLVPYINPGARVGPTLRMCAKKKIRNLCSLNVHIILEIMNEIYEIYIVKYIVMEVDPGDAIDLSDGFPQNLRWICDFLNSTYWFSLVWFYT